MANAHHTREKYAQIAQKLRGRKRTIETRRAIANALLGHKHSPETLEKMRKPRSAEGRKNISKAMLGKTPWNKGKTGIYSQETIEKIRSANLGKKAALQVRLKMRDARIAFLKGRNPNYNPFSYELGEKRRKHSDARNERIRKNGGRHTKSQWDFLKAAYDYKCRMCGRKEPEIKLTKDHIVPLGSGGTNDISNIQPLCRSCNSKKGLLYINLAEVKPSLIYGETPEVDNA